MDETAPTTPGSDSATPDVHRPQATALPAEYGMFTSDGMSVPEPADTAKAISDGAEALGMPSTLPTADTAPPAVKNSQAGLAGDRTRLGGPIDTEDAARAVMEPGSSTGGGEPTTTTTEAPSTTTTTTEPETTTTPPTTTPGLGNPSRSGYAQPELRAPYSVNLGNTTTHPDPSKVAQEAAGIAKGRLIQGQWNHVEIPPRTNLSSTESQNPTA